MKLDRLETHDRFKQFIRSDFSIGECGQDLVNQRPFGNVPFYLFVHARTDDDGVTKRLIWQPRLTRPKAQTNSMLFKVYPGSDKVKVIWKLPAREMWKQFQKGNITEDQIVIESINAFEHDRKRMEAPEEDDLDDATIDNIYKEISQEAKAKRESLALNQKEHVLSN